MEPVTLLLNLTAPTSQSPTTLKSEPCYFAKVSGTLSSDQDSERGSCVTGVSRLLSQCPFHKVDRKVRGDAVICVRVCARVRACAHLHMPVRTTWRDQEAEAPMPALHPQGCGLHSSPEGPGQQLRMPRDWHVPQSSEDQVRWDKGTLRKGRALH